MTRDSGDSVQKPLSIIRFYPEVRSAHLERSRQLMFGEYFYFRRRGDYDETIETAASPFRRTTTARLAWTLISRNKIDAVEVPEPLWVKYAPHSVVVLAAIKVRQLLGRGRPLIVTFAIENVDRTRVVPDRLRRISSAWTFAARLLVTWICNQLDRIVFGTSAAQSSIVSALAANAAERLVKKGTLIWSLPKSCDCARLSRSSSPLVAFVGGVESRKGADLLIAAWPQIRRSLPAAELVVAGAGPLSEELSRRGRLADGVVFTGALQRREVHQLYRRAHVLALPSQPEGAWREQVGLPVVEGLAHGCRVVTTTETGLADWLVKNDHQVLPVPTEIDALTGAVIAALKGGPFEQTPVPGLPAQDGRIAADRYLLEPLYQALTDRTSRDVR